MRVALLRLAVLCTSSSQRRELLMLAALLIVSIASFQDDCLRSLTRFAAAHWTVALLSVVQGHFCKLFACEY